MRRLGNQLQLKRSATLTVLIAAGLLPAIACGGSDSGKKSDQTGDTKPQVTKGTVTVTANFPTEAAQTTTASVHVWIIVPSGDTNCAALIGGDVDPYDLQHERLADVVSTDLGSNPVTVTADAAVGNALVYVEGVDYSGKTEWAGCKPIDISQSGTNPVTIDLGRYKIFDCGDPNTEDGSPCDDGENCTVDETCKNGQCQGGYQRNCDQLADECNAGKCDEIAGCIAEALPDNTPCDDGIACTINETCTMGECHGVTRDCAAEATQCQIVTGGCNEFTGECEFSYAPYRTSCDDGLFCTDGDYCDGSGTCVAGPARDCNGNGCATGTCNEATDTCDTITNQPAGTACYDVCQTGEVCNGTGQCAGTPVDCSAYSSGDCDIGICDPTYGGCTSEYAPAGAGCSDAYIYGDADCYQPGQCNGYGTCNAEYKAAGAPCNYTGGNSDCYGPGQCDGSGYCYAPYMPSGTPCVPTTSGNPDCFLGGTCDNYGYCSANYAPYNTPCDDGDPCSTGDYCSGTGTCYSGYTYAPSTALCDDGDKCTAGDHCSGSGYCTYDLYYPDRDGDGYTDKICDTSSYGDCDDNDVAVHPFATELCADGIDNDCDGLVDSADTCTP